MNNRPVNLDLKTIRMPFPAIFSILHRISGVLIFMGMPILLWMFGKSLSSAIAFQELLDLMDYIFLKLLFFGIIAAFGYHVFAGIKHLFMDHGIGETIAGAKITTRLVLIATVLLLILLGAQL